jgi:hypothetical protein
LRASPTYLLTIYANNGKIKSVLKPDLFLVRIPLVSILHHVSLTYFLIGQSKNAGKKAVEQVLTSRRTVEILQERSAAAEEAVLNADFSELIEADEALADSRKKLQAAQLRLRQQEAALGVAERETLAKLMQNEYLTVRMNTRALKSRIRERLRQ